MKNKKISAKVKILIKIEKDIKVKLNKVMGIRINTIKNIKDYKAVL